MALYVQGSTVIGVKVGDGVVLAADKTFNLGNLVISNKAKKVHLIDDRIAIGAAWMYADSQALTSIIRRELEYYKLTTKTPLTVKGVSLLVSRILYSSKLLPYLTEILIGGIDKTGSHLYVLDSLGGMSEESYAALGTGATIALGVLEEKYREKASIEEAEKLVLDSIKAATKRDSASGGGVDIIVIGTEGVKEYSETL